MNMKHAALALLAGSLLLGPSTLAIAEDEHHPGETPPQQAAPPAPPAPRQQGPGPGMAMPGTMPKPGQSPMGQQGMGEGGQAAMPMAAMMNQRLAAMSMSGMDDFAEAFPGSGMMQRVEGRIAFLRAELKIGEPQLAAWTEFAQALRDNAKTLGDAHAKAVKRQASANAPLTLAERLATQEDWFAARAAGIGALRRGIEGLYAVLSDTQKQAADDLLAPHLGMGSGGRPMMGMMSMGMMSMGGMPMPGPAGGATH